MGQFKGFFELQKPADLLAKLRHDYKRLQSMPTDTYAAYDFFVTGYHMLDWLYPDPDPSNKKRREQAKQEYSLAGLFPYCKWGEAFSRYCQEAQVCC